MHTSHKEQQDKAVPTCGICHVPCLSSTLLCTSTTKLDAADHEETDEAAKTRNKHTRSKALCSTERQGLISRDAEQHLAAKTSPLLFTKHIPTLRLCSSRSLLVGALAASPGCLKTSLDEQCVTGGLLTHDLMRFMDDRLCPFRLCKAPSVRTECCNIRIVAEGAVFS